MKGSTYVEVHMLSRNHIAYYIKPVNLKLDSVSIIEMQGKVQVCREKDCKWNYNYSNEMIYEDSRSHDFKKEITKCYSYNFGYPGIQKILNLISPNYLLA